MIYSGSEKTFGMMEMLVYMVLKVSRASSVVWAVVLEVVTGVRCCTVWCRGGRGSVMKQRQLAVYP